MNKFHFQLIPSIFFLIALAILLSLGTWQVKRLSWKNDLIDIISSRVNLAAEALPDMEAWKHLKLEDVNYRKVEARGRFDNNEEIHIFTQVAPGKAKYSGTGFWVITPFLLDSGGVVLVNRGFVPEKFKQKRTRLSTQVKGQQTIIGIIKTDQGTNYFTPDTDYKRNIWFTRNISAISNHLELKNAAPFLIALTKAENANLLPQPRDVKITLSNNHLGYAITWFGLALTLIGVFAAFSLKPRQE